MLFSTSLGGGVPDWVFCCWAPFAASITSKVASGRGAEMSQNLFKKTLLEPISMCCWPRLLVKIAPNRSFFTFGPPFRPAFRASSLRGGGPKFLKICSKIHFLSNSRCNAGPDFWLQLIQIEASSLLGVSLAPLCGQNSIALASWSVVRCHTHKYTHKPS